MAHIDGNIYWNTLYGTAYGDTIHPGAGNDLVYAGNGNDLIDDYGHGLTGSGGDDDFYGEGGNDVIYAWTGNDYVDGGSGNDSIYGEAGNDDLWGWTGNDSISGGSGKDNLYGEVGNDLLDGGAGADFIAGGQGADRFVYHSTGDSTGGSRDLIASFDFNADRIDLSAIDANVTAAGNQAFHWTDATSGVPLKGYLMAVAGSGGQTVILGNTDNDLYSELQIVVNDGSKSPAYWIDHDFFL
ncbi:MAG: calcium-binding protein [Amaricoccus sp.]